MTNSTSAPTILVDGSSYLYRAFYAVKGLTDAKGRPTGAIRGVISMLQNLQKTYANSKIVVVFDAKGKTFRHELSGEYKATRPPMPDELRAQIEPIHAMVRAMGLRLLVIEGVEADDVIGTLAQAASHSHPVMIATGDKDMAQLVNAHVTLLDTMKNELSDCDSILAKYGVAPAQIVDFLALTGDKSDNIKGVEKCGPVTAAKWLQKYGDLAGVIAHADEIGGKVGENLRAAIHYLPTSYQLATIKTDVELPADDSHAADNTALAKLYAEYSFNTWLKQLGVSVAAPQMDHENTAYYLAPGDLANEFKVLTSEVELAALIEKLSMFQGFAIEILSENQHLVGIAISCEHGKAAYMPVGHDALSGAQLPLDLVLGKLAPLLAAEHIAIYGYDLKSMWHQAAACGLEIRAIGDDCLLAAYVLHAEANNKLSALAQRYLQLDVAEYVDLTGKGAKRQSLASLPISELGALAMARVAACLRLGNVLAAERLALPQINRLYQDIELPCAAVLAAIEARGVGLDVAYLQQQSADLAENIANLEQDAYQSAGRAFNLQSPVQLREVLFNELALPVLAKTPKGEPSTAEEVLQQLADGGALLPKILLEHRSLTKLKSTYTDKLPLLVDADHRVHTHYNQAVTATGRLSSSDPNLQNIPVRTSLGRRIRAAFVAPAGRVIVAADYSQIELRIMAHLSKDPMLLAAFNHHQDIHSATAAEVFAVPLNLVTKAQRRAAKAVNFGLIYGMSAFGLAKNLNVSRSEAQSYVDSYFARYQKVRAYMDESRALAKEQGFVETIFGRRLYLPDIHSKNGARRAHAERTAINAPMQGSAADIIKIAMLNIERELIGSQTARLIMQVHDELVFEVKDTELDAISTLIRQQMMHAAKLLVPLEVDIGSGANWDAAH